MKRFLFCSFLTVLLSANVYAAQSASAVPVKSRHEELMDAYKKAQRESDAKKAKKANEKSIWDDTAEVNPFFKQDGKTASKPKSEKTVSKAKKTTFKRRVYVGPTKAEAQEFSAQRAIGNFDAIKPSGNFEIRYGDAQYSNATDSFNLLGVRFLPVAGSPDAGKIEAYATIQNLSMKGYGFGKNGPDALNPDGETTASGIEIPIYNEKNVKSGLMTISKLRLVGNFPELLKNGAGDFATVEVAQLKSEKIINELLLNNIVRSKVFSASSATFRNAKLDSSLIASLKDQRLDGLSFETALINMKSVPTVEGVLAAMTSYSARILNVEMIQAARNEATKDNPDLTKEQLKKNVKKLRKEKAKLRKKAAADLKSGD